MTQMPLQYDLITITWNSGETLQRTLDSVLKQAHKPKRYIFVDANSNDDTLKIINRFRQHATDIKVIVEQQSAKGISQAWNQALEFCRSEIICLLNSDDWYLADTMENVLKQFDVDKSLQVLSGSILYCKDENDDSPKLMTPKPLWQMPLKMCFMHPANFVKKEVYEKLGDFDEDLKCSMDYDFMFRAMKTNIKIDQVKEVFTYMQAGGVANSTRELARRETWDVALKNGNSFIPRLSYLLRIISGK